MITKNISPLLVNFLLKSKQKFVPLPLNFCPNNTGILNVLHKQPAIHAFRFTNMDTGSTNLTERESVRASCFAVL